MYIISFLYVLEGEGKANHDAWGEYADIFRYLSQDGYPADTPKEVKRRIREKAAHFVLDKGILKHKDTKGKLTRVIVDGAERDKVVQSLHADVVGGCHFGQSATIRKVTDRFYWRKVAADVRKYVQGCGPCQKANPSTKAHSSTLHPIPVKDLFHRWGIDMVGPLKETKNGNKYLIVATEYLSKWAEAKAVPDKSALGIHQFVMDLVYRFGATGILLHDQGKEFNNTLMKDLCSILEIDQAMTSSYHPQTNG